MPDREGDNGVACRAPCPPAASPVIVSPSGHIAIGGLEIGYWVRTDATGRGHATRPAALATAVASGSVA